MWFLVDEEDQTQSATWLLSAEDVTKRNTANAITARQSDSLRQAI